MFILSFIARIVAILRAAASPAQIAAGFVLGMGIGLVPSMPITIIIVLLLIVFAVNIATALLAAMLFSAIASLMDPLLGFIGYAFLVDFTLLHPLWVTLYNTPFVPYSGFNNTVVLGSIILFILLIAPAFVLVKSGIVIYRRDYDEKIANLKAVRYLKATVIYQLYIKLRQLGEQLL